MLAWFRKELYTCIQCHLNSLWWLKSKAKNPLKFSFYCQSVVTETGTPEHNRYFSTIYDVWAMLDYLNAGWDQFHTVEGGLSLASYNTSGRCTIRLLWAKTKLAGHWQCSLISMSSSLWLCIWRIEQGNSLWEHLQRMGWGRGSILENGEKGHCAPCYRAFFLVLSEAQCKVRGTGRCPTAMIFWPSWAPAREEVLC